MWKAPGWGALGVVIAFGLAAGPLQAHIIKTIGVPVSTPASSPDG